METGRGVSLVMMRSWSVSGAAFHLNCLNLFDRFDGGVGTVQFVEELGGCLQHGGFQRMHTKQPRAEDYIRRELSKNYAIAMVIDLRFPQSIDSVQ